MRWNQGLENVLLESTPFLFTHHKETLRHFVSKLCFRHTLNAMVWIASVLLTGNVGSANNLVTNGTFDISVPRNGTGGGWTSDVIDGSGGWVSSGGNPGANFILNSNGGASDPIIVQTVNGLVPGSCYGVSGDFTNIYPGFGSLAALSFGVAVDGVFLFEGQKGTADVWQHFSFSFTPTSGSVALLLAGERNGDDSSYRIDNISLDLLNPACDILACDINNDQIINLIDFSLLAAKWLDTNCDLCDGADLTGDGNVDHADLLVCIETWLDSNLPN